MRRTGGASGPSGSWRRSSCTAATLSSGSNDARFYFVGYEMAKAIERRCGTECIPRLFAQPPIMIYGEDVTHILTEEGSNRESRASHRWVIDPIVASASSIGPPEPSSCPFAQAPVGSVEGDLR